MFIASINGRFVNVTVLSLKRHANANVQISDLSRLSEILNLWSPSGFLADFKRVANYFRRLRLLVLNKLIADVGFVKENDHISHHGFTINNEYFVYFWR